MVMKELTVSTYHKGEFFALGFGTTVAMWAVAYFSRLPAVMLPSTILLFLLVLCLFCGGYFAGKYTKHGFRAGIYTGVITALLNLLILGSLLSGEHPNQIVPTALLWLPGTFVFAIGTTTLPGWDNRNPLGIRSHQLDKYLHHHRWNRHLFLLLAGGLVTSQEAGLAVVDWPNSFGYNMFLYPLSRMTGGIYYEHAHRLFGSLVGLTMIVLAYHLWRMESRKAALAGSWRGDSCDYSGNTGRLACHRVTSP